MDEYEKSEGLPPDTSAIVKLYVEESGTQIVREEVEKAEVVIINITNLQIKDTPAVIAAGVLSFLIDLKRDLFVFVHH